MKNRFVILGIVALLLVASIVPAAFAEKVINNTDGVQNNWFDQMFDFHYQWLDRAETNGRVTPEQADVWRNHFNYMREFHSQNGFGGCWGGQGAYPAPVQPQGEKTSI